MAGIRLILAVLVVVSGCSQPTITLPPTSRPSATPTTLPSGQGTADTPTLECAQTVGGVAPDGPSIQGPRPLQDEGEGELDTGEAPVVLPDPDGQPLEFEVPAEPPPAAHDPSAPEALVDFATSSIDVGTPGFSLGYRPTFSFTAEPQVAVKGDRVMMAWNWMAATSHDLGQSFNPLNPETPGAIDGSIDDFCCDQLVRYFPSHDLWIWIRQYNHEGVDHNRIRLSVARGDAEFDARAFHSYFLVPQAVGYPNGVWFDQPKMAATDDNVFVSINAYETDEDFAGAIVIRLPLDALAGAGALTTDCMFRPSYTYQDGRTTYYGSPFPVLGARDTMYLASHLTNAWLSVWRWPDTDPAPSQHFVADPLPNNKYVAYRGMWELDAEGNAVKIPFDCPKESVAKTNWCLRSDERVSAGWFVDGQLGFAWNAKGEGPSSDRPRPYVWMIALDPQLLDNCRNGSCIQGYPVWGLKDRAIQYVAIAPNSAGDLGGVVLRGGGAHNLSCETIVHDSLTNSDPRSDTFWEGSAPVSLVSDAVPGNRSGDYLGIAPNGGNDLTWSGACMTTAMGTSLHSQINLVRFGRHLNEPDR